MNKLYMSLIYNVVNVPSSDVSCALGIVQYMLEQAQPASREITSKKDMDIFMKNQVDPVFMTLASSSSADVYNNHDSLANLGRESPLTFVHTFSSEVVSSIGIGTDTSAILTPER